VPFHRYTNEFNDVIERIRNTVNDTIEKFSMTQPIDGEVYVLLYQVPNHKDKNGVIKYVQEFQMRDAGMDLNYSPYENPNWKRERERERQREKGRGKGRESESKKVKSESVGPVFYVGFVVFDKYQLNGAKLEKVNKYKSWFSRKGGVQDQLDKWNKSTAPQCYLSGVGESTGMNRISGCASTKRAGACTDPKGYRTNDPQKWSYGILYIWNDTVNKTINRPANSLPKTGVFRLEKNKNMCLNVQRNGQIGLSQCTTRKDEPPTDPNLMFQYDGAHKSLVWINDGTIADNGWKNKQCVTTQSPMGPMGPMRPMGTNLVLGDCPYGISKDRKNQFIYKNDKQFHWVPDNNKCIGSSKSRGGTSVVGLFPCNTAQSQPMSFVPLKK
jgi:hypothetical protein